MSDTRAKRLEPSPKRNSKDALGSFKNFSHSAGYSFSSQTQNQKNMHALSEREIEVIRLICEGYNVQEIARILELSANTIKYYKRSIFMKTKVSGAAGLVVYAIRNEIYTIPPREDSFIYMDEHRRFNDGHA